jgi:branched-chain amino acid transport system ATP-binding protein
MTVLETVLLSLAARAGQIGVWAPLKRSGRSEEGLQVLAQFGLEPHAGRLVGELPEGSRKLLDIALAVALRPRLLLMDEPTAGVSTEDKFEVMETLVGVISGSGITTIFVEHDMDVVLRYSQRVLVFDQGLVIAQGEPAAVLADPEVRRAVLGHV